MTPTPSASAKGKSQSWQEEFGITPRLFPRPPVAEIQSFLSKIREPQVFLREATNTTDIVIRLPVSSRQLPSHIQDGYSKFGMSLPSVFDEVIWKTRAVKKNRLGVALCRLGCEAYKESWVQFFRMLYLDHFHPAVNAGMIEDSVRLQPEKGPPHGRRVLTNAEIVSLRRRYCQLLPKCRLIRRAAIETVRSLKKDKEGLDVSQIRQGIWTRVRKQVHGMRGDSLIFGGKAFGDIPYGHHRLHAPETWKPHQLAIALLALERSREYQTIEKKIRPTKSRKQPT